MSLQDFMDAMSQEKLSADDLRILNFDELEALLGEDDPTKIASMVMEASGYCDPSVGWLRQFEGTPLHAKAVALAEQDLAVEAERIQRRLAEPKDQDLWTKQDQIRLQKSLLVLELHKSRSQQPEEGEKSAVSKEWVGKMVRGAKASPERLDRFIDKNLNAKARGKRLLAGGVAAGRKIEGSLAKMEGSAQKSRKALDNMAAGISATNNKFIDEHHASMRAGEADTRRRMIAGGLLGGAASATAGLGTLALAARMSRRKTKEKKAEEEPRRPGAGTGTLAGAAGGAAAGATALNPTVIEQSSRLGNRVIEKNKKRVLQALERADGPRHARLVRMARKIEGKGQKAYLGALTAAGLGSALGTGAAVGAASKALAKYRDKKKTASEVEYTGHVNNGDPNPPKWPASALSSISDETKAKLRKALLFGGAAVIAANSARAIPGIAKGEGFKSLDRVSPEINMLGLAPIALSGLFRPGKKEKRAVSDEWIRKMVGKAKAGDKTSRGRLASFTKRNLGASVDHSSKRVKVVGDGRLVSDVSMKGGEHERKRLVAGTAGLRRLHETDMSPTYSSKVRQVMEDNILHKESLTKTPGIPSTTTVTKNKDSGELARGAVNSVIGGTLALGATGAAIKARDRHIRAKQKEERSKKASIADLARRAAAASSAKRVPISAIKGETTASGLSAVRQGIAAKASKATPAPTDVFRSAAPKKSPFDGTGTATRHAPAAPLPPGSMQSIEFLKKYKMASRR